MSLSSDDFAFVECDNILLINLLLDVSSFLLQVLNGGLSAFLESLLESGFLLCLLRLSVNNQGVSILCVVHEFLELLLQLLVVLTGHVFVLDCELLICDIDLVGLLNIDKLLLLLLVVKLFKSFQLLTLESQVTVLNDFFLLSLELLIQTFFSLCLLGLKLFGGVLFNSGLFLADVLTVLLLAETVSTVQSLL